MPLKRVRSDVNALHFGKHSEENQLCVFDVLAMDGDNLQHLWRSVRKDQRAAAPDAAPGRNLPHRLRPGRSRCRSISREPAEWGLRFGLEAPRLSIKAADQCTEWRQRAGNIRRERKFACFILRNRRVLAYAFCKGVGPEARAPLASVQWRGFCSGTDASRRSEAWRLLLLPSKEGSL